MDQLRRRSVLVGAVAGSVLASGCSGILNGDEEPTTEYETTGDDDDPIEADPESLLLAADDLGDDWERFGEEGDEVQHQRSFSRGDGDVLLARVERHETVDEAAASLDDPDEADASHDIGTAGYTERTDSRVNVFFRDANVEALVSHTDDDGGDDEVAHETAAAMHERWR